MTEFDSSFTDVEGETRAKKSDDDLVRICVAINSNTPYVMLNMLLIVTCIMSDILSLPFILV